MEEYHYFVAHEFTTQERDDLREAIDRAFKGTGLNASYADMEFRSGEHILKKIEDRILATQFGIYDITTENPNVYLELGLAKGAGKTLYIICKKGTKIRADLQGLDRIEYESYKNLTDEIQKKIIKKELEGGNAIKAQRKGDDPHHLVPPINFNITQDLSNGQKRSLPDVGIDITHNGDSLPVKVSVAAQVFLGKKDLGIVKTSQYTGKRLWNLNPHFGIRGHFQVPSEVVNSTEQIEIRVFVTVIDQFERKHQFLPLAWVYMRDINSWYLEPCGNDT